MSNDLRPQYSDIIFYASSEGNIRVEVLFSDELKEVSTIRKIRIVQKEGNRDVARDVDFYNLDAIIAVGYRVNSYQATVRLTIIIDLSILKYFFAIYNFSMWYEVLVILAQQKYISDVV